MFDVITFGETMIRLSPPNYRRLEQTNLLDVNVGGAEMSVAVGLSRLANAMGALGVSRKGPMEGTFSREEVEAFMRGLEVR